MDYSGRSFLAQGVDGIDAEGSAGGPESGGGGDGGEQSDGCRVAERIEAADAVEKFAEDLREAGGGDSSGERSEAYGRHKLAEERCEDMGLACTEGEADGDLPGAL